MVFFKSQIQTFVILFRQYLAKNSICEPSVVNHNDFHDQMYDRSTCRFRINVFGFCQQNYMFSALPSIKNFPSRGL